MPAEGSPPAQRLRRRVRREWQTDRLQLAGLDGRARTLAIACLVVLGANAALLVVLASGSPLPGADVLIPGRLVDGTGAVAPVAVPTLPIVLALGSLAAVAGVVAEWSVRVAGLPGRAVRIVVAAAMLSMWGRILAEIPNHRALAEAGVERVGAIADATTVVGWLAVASAAALATVPTAWLASRRPVAPLLAASPPLLALGIFAVGLAAAAPAPLGIELPPDYPRVIAAGADVVAAVVRTDATLLAALLLVPYALWQSIVAARFGRREVAIRVARGVREQAWLLPAMLAAKLAWLGLGYLAILPDPLGGGAEVWTRSRTDGPAAWVIAAALVSAAVAWLLASRPISITERGFRPAASALVVGMSAATVAGATLLVLAGVSLLIPIATVSTSIMGVTGSAADLIAPTQVVTVVGATLVGAALVRDRRTRASGLTFLVFAAWGVPRAIDVAPELLFGAASGSRALSVEPATFDTALTLALAALAVAWWAGAQRRITPPLLTIVLVVSTLVVHAGTLVPPGAARMALFVGILFPPLYALLLDSRELNRASTDRPARLLGDLARRVGLMTLVTVGLALGAPRGSIGEFGQLLFGLPFAALLVGETISRRRTMELRRARGRTPAGAPAGSDAGSPNWAAAGRLREAGSAGAGAVAGIAVVLVLALAAPVAEPLGLWSGAGGPASSTAPSVPPSSAPAPSPTARPIDLLARYVAGAIARTAGDPQRLERLGSALAAGDAAGIAGIGREMATLARDDLAWSRAMPAHPCFRDVTATYDRWREDVARAGDAVVALAGGDGDPDVVLGLLAAPLDDQAAFESALIAARTACGGPTAPPATTPTATP